jgi:phosphopantetheinyl transferase (holo-ACP synthase)
MTGNDLVDLQVAAVESNWKRRGFLDKIFNGIEQDLIHKAAIPQDMVWLLWSMKEAAYKIYNRRTGIRTYAPIKLNCKITRKTTAIYYGEVRISDQCYYTKSTVISGDLIHTIAGETMTAADTMIEKIYPLSLQLDYKTMEPACVSHHGQYLALIF